jgi:hypothetical protein
MKAAVLILTACAALTAQAADVAPAAKPAPTQAASAPAAKTTSKPAGTAPMAGGNGGGLSSDGSNLGTQVGPKKPKCPDPLNTACPAVKTPVSK